MVKEAESKDRAIASKTEEGWGVTRSKQATCCVSGSLRRNVNQVTMSNRHIFLTSHFDVHSVLFQQLRSTYLKSDFLHVIFSPDSDCIVSVLVYFQRGQMKPEIKDWITTSSFLAGDNITSPASAVKMQEELKIFVKCYNCLNQSLFNYSVSGQITFHHVNI